MEADLRVEKSDELFAKLQSQHMEKLLLCRRGAIYPKNRKSSKTEVRQIIIASPNSNRTHTLVVFFFIVAAFFFVYFIHSQYHFFYWLESAEHKQSNSLVGTLYHVDRQKRFILVKPNAPCGLVIWVSKPTWVLPRILYCSEKLERRKAKTPPRAFE